MPRVKMGDHYFLTTNFHVANEELHFPKGSKTMLQQITHGAIQVDKKKKIVQFDLIFHLLNYGWPHNKWHLPLFILFNIKWRGAKDWRHLLPQNAIFALTIRKVWFLRPIMCICNVFIFARQECCEAAWFACIGICLLEKNWPKTAEWDRVAKPVVRFLKVFEKKKTYNVAWRPTEQVA
jgi:hypothetical protein